MADDKADQNPTPAQTKETTTQDIDKNVLHIKLYSPFRTYYDQEALSLSAVNKTGPFDILPQHHNFMTLLEEGDIIIRDSSGEKKVRISHAVLHVKNNRVTVFLDV